MKRRRVDYYTGGEAFDEGRLKTTNHAMAKGHEENIDAAARSLARVNGLDVLKIKEGITDYTEYQSYEIELGTIKGTIWSSTTCYVRVKKNKPFPE